MKIVKTSKELVELLSSLKQSGNKIGFVPTMGALHAGHISLLEIALKENDVVICSIFVNPTQFNDPKDLEKYPRPIEKDTELLEKAGCSILFLPEVEDIYGDNTPWTHTFGDLENIWEGAMRPGHFKGVGQVVYKLFNIVKPDNAYFGQKDFQQTLIIKRLIQDFKLPIELHICPIIREKNGLAMSSRNIRLNDAEHLASGKIYEALMSVKTGIDNQEFDFENLLAKANAILQSIPSIQLEYIDLVNPETLQKVLKINQNDKLLMIIAVKFGTTRLIDNMYVKS
ncbi:MAG: pantoate--beta-alanine ligase [Sphingobacteriales bacterium]|nr:pantoate--beta-alanine ligase [Sphingobacteriales bacterium]